MIACACRCGIRFVAVSRRHRFATAACRNRANQIRRAADPVMAAADRIGTARRNGLASRARVGTARRSVLVDPSPEEISARKAEILRAKEIGAAL